MGQSHINCDAAQNFAVLVSSSVIIQKLQSYEGHYNTEISIVQRVFDKLCVIGVSDVDTCL